MKALACLPVLVVLTLVGALATRVPASPPASPRVDYVDTLPQQPQQDDPATIWYDDFDTGNPAEKYYEYDDNAGECVPVDSEHYGSAGQALRARFQQGEVGAGGVKVFFGRNPGGSNRQLLRRPDEDFREVYWRLYLKHQAGWEGNPGKLSRATSLAGPNWSQAMIAHHWGGEGMVLCLDPASGIKDNRLVTTQYNDFDNLCWLGLRNGRYPIFSTDESGHWVCVECYVKLNTSGQKDGVFTAWLDGKEDATRTGLDWVGTRQEYGINAVFLENYWNSGSVKEQERYFDNFVISTKPLGPVVTPTNPTIVKTPFADPDPEDKQSAWEVEVSSDTEGRDIVWTSGTIEGEGNQVVVSVDVGNFTGSAANLTALAPDQLYWVRVRQADSANTWSDWSPWHAAFKTAAK